MITNLRGRKVVSIAAAPGWRAMFAEEGFNSYLTNALAYWALLDNGQVYAVTAYDEMSGECELADDDKYFIGLLPPDEEIPDDIGRRIEIVKETIEEDQQDKT